MLLDFKLPGQKIKDICTKLGEPYQVRLFDARNVIYRDLGNGYDFEIGGLDNKEADFNATLYIWHTNSYSQKIVETIDNIKSFENLSSVLNEKAKYYLNKKID